MDEKKPAKDLGGYVDHVDMLFEEVQGKLDIAMGEVKEMLASEINDVHAEITDTLLAAAAEIGDELGSGTDFYTSYHDAIDQAYIKVVDRYKNESVYHCRRAEEILGSPDLWSRVAQLQQRGVPEGRREEIAAGEMEHVNAIKYHCEIWNRHGTLYCHSVEDGVLCWRWVKHQVVHLV